MGSKKVVYNKQKYEHMWKSIDMDQDQLPLECQCLV